MKKNLIKKEPLLIAGDLAVDDRGEVGFVNEFDMKLIRRFYTVANHTQGFIRAWHGHMKECKYVTVVNGAAIIACVKIDNLETPSKDAKIHKYILSSSKPTIVFIPGGYANGSMSLTTDTKLMVFSDSTLEESQKDDMKYDAYYWDPWQIVGR